ncbi:MAG: pyruvate, phosphate dikinase, partial [Paludibacteraceae bacterium]|nr:pyruvate, phosphate dikinase [Paludibacteraceae bacterium]
MMRYKVKNILFVSTLYDAFILESEDNFFGQFMGGEIYQFSLFSLPRTTAVTSSEEALDMLHTMKFDLVILMVGIDKKQPIELSKRIHRRYKNLPIYLLINQKDDIKHFEDLVPATNSIDKMFVWNGESQILFSIVKSIEDRANVENDTAVGLVRVILLIEDNSLYFSRYLQYLYSIVFNQIDQSLRDVDHNEINKISKMRSRPKILHASNYEDAMYFFEKYKNFLLCVISDAEFERNGTLDKNAGATFIRHVQSQMLSLPMILQSSDPENENVAKDLGVTFINKKSSSLFNDLKTFLISQLGFGDFVFRDATNGKPIAVARSLKEFLSILKYIPEQTIKMHSDENQFSLWLMSRGEIQLAKRVNPLLYSDFTSVDEYRNKLLDLFNEYSEERNRGKILNFDDVNVVTERNIVSMSGGSFGGKGRGLAFINVLIYNTDFSKFTDDINICMPKTVIIGTDEFDYFMKENNLYEFLAEGHTYMEIRERFVEARISEAIWTKLARFLTQTQKPLAVRSSSLSEDSLAQPFAGVFDTYVVPNNEDHKVELKQLSKAIKLVYASIFSDESKHYFDAIHRKVEEEKMAVVLEELVGRQHGNYYYPHISGTAQSYNYYPVAHMKPDEGFVNAAV